MYKYIKTVLNNALISVSSLGSFGSGLPTIGSAKQSFNYEERITMADYNLDTANTTSNKKRPDGYCNLLVETTNKGNVKKTQIGEYGIALDKNRKLDALILKLAEENPDALQKLILSVRVTVMDESNNTDEMELVLA